MVSTTGKEVTVVVGVNSIICLAGDVVTHTAVSGMASVIGDDVAVFVFACESVSTHVCELKEEFICIHSF